MSIYLYGLLWVGGAALITALFAYLVRRIGATEGTVENNEAAGQVFTLVGGLQAVLTAFVLISLFDRASAAEDGSYAEADSLIAAVWAAEDLSEPARSQAAPLARQYAATVIYDEWPHMRDGTSIGGNGWGELDRLRKTVAAAPVSDEWTTDRKLEAANKLWQVYKARHERLNTSTSREVSTVVWFALLAGGVMAVALPLVFGGPRPATHILIVSVLGATVTLLLYATYQLQNPYSGGAHVDPAAFESAVDRLR